MRPNTASGMLRSFVDRIERVSEERDDLGADLSEIYKEAKSAGFDKKALRNVVRARKMDPGARQEQDHLFAVYWGALHGDDSLDPETGEIDDEQDLTPEGARAAGEITTEETAPPPAAGESPAPTPEPADQSARGESVVSLEPGASNGPLSPEQPAPGSDDFDAEDVPPFLRREDQ